MSMRMRYICRAQIAKKMCAALPIDILQIRQAKIELIDKRGGLQGVAVAFVAHALSCRTLQFAVNLGR